jgi:hypothetical protein
MLDSFAAEEASCISLSSWLELTVSPLALTAISFTGCKTAPIVTRYG